MPFSKRSVPCDTILVGELLIGLFLLTSAAPARAGEDHHRGRKTIAAGEVIEGSQDEVWERHKLLFGDEKSPDPVLLRGGWYSGDQSGSFNDPEKARRLEEILGGLEERLSKGLNEGKWIPFRNRDHKTTGPETLFLLDAPTAAAPVAPDSWKNRFRLRLSSGLEYRQEWPTGERNRKLQMRVFGPVVPGGPGLGLRLEGHVLDRPFQLNAYGGTNEAGLRFDVEF